MVTYLELGSEPVWGQQITPPNMLELFVKPLRAFYSMGPALIGAPGDNRHLRGRHRSRDWDLTSAYCTNRTYATTDARDKAGEATWYRAVDIGITGQTLYAASKRLDSLVRSGADGGKVAEWFGTFDGKTVVGWFEGHASSSDESHLFHLHVGVWTKWANDADLMQLLYTTITGTGDTTMAQQVLVRYKGDARVWLADRMYRREVPPAELVDDPANTTLLGAIVNGTTAANGPVVDISGLAGGPLANASKVYQSGGAIGELTENAWGIDIATLQTGGGSAPTGPVDLTEAAMNDIRTEVRDAVADGLEGGSAAVRADS